MKTLLPVNQEEARRELAGLCSGGSRVLIQGSGSFSGLRGQSPKADVVLSTLKLDRIVFHEPEELIVRVEAGVTMAALAGRLAEKGQEVSWDLPWPERQTVGGVIAAGIAGPRRAFCGAPRDHVLGLRVALPEGKLVGFGGRVVKNAAGYDLVRLMVGSRGTLGLILEVTLLVRPLPEERVAFEAAPLGRKAAIELADEIKDSPLTPSFLELKGVGEEWRMVLGFEGPREAVKAAREKAAGMLAQVEGREFMGAEAKALLARWVREVWDAPGPVFRGNVARGRAGRLLDSVAGSGCRIVMSADGSLRAFPGQVEGEGARAVFDRLAAAAVKEGGWAVQERGPIDPAECAAGVPDSARRLNETVRRAFDPAGLLSTGAV